VKAVPISAPLFSIGVTTYRRPAMLRECLDSILGQTLGDFDVVVGNDDPEGPFSLEALGIRDPRVRVLNYEQNHGPIRNANRLLEISRSPYFTWLADDDMYAPTFLEAVHAALKAHGDLRCVFTSYLHGRTFTGAAAPPAKVEVLTGRDFLSRYLARRTPVVGCYGVFDRDYLRGIGGMEHLGTARFSLYADNLLAIRAGLLDKVGYVDAPLVYFRAHDGSSSATSPDLRSYRTAQEDLFRHCVSILTHEQLRPDYRANQLRLLRWCVSDYASVVRRAGSIDSAEAVAYVMFLKTHARALKVSAAYLRLVAFVGKTASRLAWWLALNGRARRIGSKAAPARS
jgi:glycosyltransferase involved in cell wall biosynthesis